MIHACGLVTGVLLLGAAAPTTRWDFEDARPGRLPDGWTAAKTGEGPGSVWKVLVDPTAPSGPKVLAQTSSEGPRRLFNLCVADRTSYKDVDITLALKAVEGKIDQGGGPVWRYQDADNYYVARWNPLETNFRVYKVVEGKRSRLATVEDVTEAAGQWHTIHVVQKSNRIEAWLNGKHRLEVTDDSFTTAGKIGLWTKADAVTRFDAIQASRPD